MAVNDNPALEASQAVALDAVVARATQEGDSGTIWLIRDRLGSQEFDRRYRLPNLAKPTVHINGTSREALKEQYSLAHTAVNNAMRVVGLAAPHGRDYYVQDGNVIRQATREHAERLERLQSVADELLALFEAVDQ